MASESTTAVELALDVSEAVGSSADLNEILDSLRRTSENLGTAMSKVFKPMQSSLKGIHTTVQSVNKTLSELAGKLTEVKTMTETTQDSGGMFDWISEGYDSLLGFIGQLETFDGNTEKIEGLFSKVTSSSNMGELVKNLLPKADKLSETVSGWVNKSVFGTINKALENGNISGSLANTLNGVATTIQNTFSKIGSAFSSMSLGWGAAIAGIITLIVLLVTNWDTLKAAIITAWETIQSALATAAEWLNTTVIQPIVGFFTSAWEMISTALVTAVEWINTTVIQPIVGFFTTIWDGLVAVFTGIGEWVQETIIQPVMDFFTPLVEWFMTLFESIKQTVSDAFYNIGVIISGCWEILQAVWGVVSEWFNTKVIQPVAQFFRGLWTGICNVAISAWEGIKGAFSAVAEWFDQYVVQPVANFFKGLWEGFKNAAVQAWEGVKSVFSKVASFFKDVFSKAWAGVVAIFAIAGEIFVNIKNGILTAFKTIVNGIISGINKVVAVPFNGINSALSVIRNISILGLTPFAGLGSISVPQIPYLAKGAVLPANRPFLAVVGDQRHGTNVEAPLGTIQEAVALVMDDHIAAMMAGFQALLNEQRATRQTIEGIQIGDTVIGQACDRYRSKMAVVHGGW